MKKFLFNSMCSVGSAIFTLLLNWLFFYIYANSKAKFGLVTYILLGVVNCTLQLFLGKRVLKSFDNNFILFISSLIVPIAFFVSLIFISVSSLGLLFSPADIFASENNTGAIINFGACFCFFLFPMVSSGFGAQSNDSED